MKLRLFGNFYLFPEMLNAVLLNYEVSAHVFIDQLGFSIYVITIFE